jgi:hypothetical protein
MTTQTTPKTIPAPPNSRQAIAFAIEIDDHYDRLEFLIAFNDGDDLSEWLDDYIEWKGKQNV